MTDDLARRFRVVVSDHTFPTLDVERAVLDAADAALVAVQCQDPRELVGHLEQADAVLVQFAPIDATVLASMKRCRVVVRYGIGVDNVDLEAAREVGIPVSNVPDYALDEVADHAMALLLASARKLTRVADDVREGTWSLSPHRPLHSLSGSSLGLAGFGAIGRRVAARAKGFGLTVRAFDPYVADEAFVAAGVERVDWPTLLASSRLLSVHLPLTDDTRGRFDDDAFAAMPVGSVFVNTSRGGVVDTPALLRALETGHVAFAGLDVLDEEPASPDAPIVRHANTIVTSHCAWYTEEALARLQRHAAEEVARALRGEPLAYVVNGVR